MSRGLLNIVGLIFGLILVACSVETMETKLPKPPVDPRITFIELGSVRCIPCKKMQPVMTSIERKYGGQVEVIFYDIWEADQKEYASQYGIKLIPTQIFLDSTGTELMRHEGYFPEAEIDSLLVHYGLIAKPITG
ncbi:MAG: thioredoxin family protein [Candidatus Marinimicrobia bacterium]|nr:thioredoxin family protein [Candidatus Neomarinimicrobiota bacterium]